MRQKDDEFKNICISVQMYVVIVVVVVVVVVVLDDLMTHIIGISSSTVLK